VRVKVRLRVELRVRVRIELRDGLRHCNESLYTCRWCVVEYLWQVWFRYVQ
jgi:hypothetical protein